MKKQVSNNVCFVVSLLMFGMAHGSHCFAQSPVSVHNIVDYGAVADGETMNTAAVQKAIDTCHASDGGVVRVPRGEFQIGTIRLKSNVTLSLDHGAVLLGSEKIADYPTEGIDDPREGGPWCLIYATDAENVSIEGLGVIDGRGTHTAFPRQTKGMKRGEYLPRPRLVRMVNCENVTLKGNTYKRPAYWGIHLIESRNVLIQGVTVRFRNNNFNNDGIDLDGCEDVVLENCDIDSGDDAICLKSTKEPCRNIVIRNCKVASNTAPLKFGTSSVGGFINITVTNCYFYDSPMGAIKLLLVDGGRMENIEISRIVMENVGNPIFIRLGNRGRSYADGDREGFQGADVEPEGAPIGVVKNIHIHDITAMVTYEDREKAAGAGYRKGKVETSPVKTEREKAKAGPIMISGIPGHLVEDIVLTNIEISYPGGGTEADASLPANEVPEDVARYPEQYFFGVLPSWGAYVRHAKNVEFDNVRMTTRGDDARQKVQLTGVEGFVEK